MSFSTFDYECMTSALQLARMGLESTHPNPRVGCVITSGGQVVGKTSADGTVVETDPYTSQDMMASVCHALDIGLETRFTATNGRPMKIANGGKVIKELFS